jgi:hypothetical protein
MQTYPHRDDATHHTDDILYRNPQSNDWATQYQLPVAIGHNIIVPHYRGISLVNITNQKHW